MPGCGPCLQHQERAIAAKAQPEGHYGFVGKDVALSCGQCIRKHGEKYRFPDMPGRYVEAWSLFLLLMDQQRIGMEPIGLDYTVLPAVFDLLGVEASERRRLFEDLVILSNAHNTHRSRERVRDKDKREAEKRLGQMHGGRRG